MTKPTKQTLKIAVSLGALFDTREAQAVLASHGERDYKRFITTEKTFAPWHGFPVVKTIDNILKNSDHLDLE